MIPTLKEHIYLCIEGNVYAHAVLASVEVWGVERRMKIPFDFDLTLENSA